MREVDEAVAKVNEATGFLVTGQLTGSTYICGKGNDIDVLVKPVGDWSSKWDGMWFILNNAGCKMDGTYQDADDYFQSFRMDGGVNVIVCRDAKVYEDISRASEVCKALFLLLPHGVVTKQVRVLVHRILRDNQSAEMAFDTTTRDIPVTAP